MKIFENLTYSIQSKILKPSHVFAGIEIHSTMFSVNCKKIKLEEMDKYKTDYNFIKIRESFHYSKTYTFAFEGWILRTIIIKFYNFFKNSYQIFNTKV